jgi:hypothetical protein
MLIFKSMPSFPVLDNKGNSHRITLLSWFQTEQRIEVRLEIKPSPPRFVSWFELTGEIGSASRIDIGSQSPSRTVADREPGDGAIQCLSFRPRLNPEATEIRLVLRGPTQSIALSVGV